MKNLKTSELKAPTFEQAWNKYVKPCKESKESQTIEPLFPEALAWHRGMKITTRCPQCKHNALVSILDGSEYCELLGYVCDWCGYEDF